MSDEKQERIDAAAAFLAGVDGDIKTRAIKTDEGYKIGIDWASKRPCAVIWRPGQMPVVVEDWSKEKTP